MRTFLWVTILVTGLVLFGCDSSEQPKKQTTATKQPVKAEEPKKQENTEVTVPAVVAAQAAADKTQEKVDLTAKMTEDTTEKSAEMATTNVEEAVKVTEESVEKVEEQKTSAETMASDATEKAVTTTQEVSIPQEMTLEASYGNITFPHGMHSETYECTVCHGNGTPDAFDLTKDVAHPLCKDCHKKEGAGPTGCKGCHQK